MLEKLSCYMARVIIFLIMGVLIAGLAGCLGYNLPPSQNLEIRDWYDLDAIRDNLGGDHTLMNDLDSTTPGYTELASPTADGGKGWKPIGSYLEPGECPYRGFLGTFEGQGYAIRDIFINRPDERCVGLFSVLGGVHYSVGGVIKDISIVNITVTGDYRVGGLVGQNSDSTLSNCYSTGNVTGNESVGGLVGANSGTVSNSYSSGSVSGNESVGGLLGVNWGGTVSNSYYNYDKVSINGENVITAGALFGEDFDEWLNNDKFLDVDERLSQKKGHFLLNNVSDLKQLLALGQNDTLKFRLTNDLDLVDEPNFYIPYFAGEFDGNGHKICNLSCDFSSVSHIGLFGYIAHGGKVAEVGVENVNITGTWWVGGLAGFNDGTVSNSYSTGSVTGNWYVGGLMGVNWDSDTVSNSYSTGSVTGTRGVGGLVGANWGGTVSRSYSTGNVSGNEHVGGLAGENMGGGLISKSFWDIETSGQATSDGGTGKNTTEMQDISTFSGAAWDIRAVNGAGERNRAGIWNIIDGLTYPFLSWQAV
jgi:hypothetical protein